MPHSPTVFAMNGVERFFTGLTVMGVVALAIATAALVVHG